MKVLILILFTAVVACAPAPTVSYKTCMELVLSQADRDFCETLNK